MALIELCEYQEEFIFNWSGNNPLISIQILYTHRIHKQVLLQLTYAGLVKPVLV